MWDETYSMSQVTSPDTPVSFECMDTVGDDLAFETWRRQSGFDAYVSD